MTGPGDEIAPRVGGRGHLRASHADRDRVIETLKAAFVQGMLDKDEFDLRVGETFASRTYAQLAAVAADIPAGLTAAGPHGPAGAQEQSVARRGPVLGAATAGYAGVWAYVLFLSPHQAPPLIFGGGLTWGIASLLCAGRMVTLRCEKRSCGQPPRRIDAGGQAPLRLPSGDRGTRLPPSQRVGKHSAEAARRREWRRALPGCGPWAGGALALVAGTAHP
jgi:Domain of unknown function (DUF1707)